MSRNMAHGLFTLALISVLGTGVALTRYAHFGWGLVCLALAGIPIYALYRYRTKHPDNGVVKR